jgi:uncharacterized membrane protein
MVPIYLIHPIAVHFPIVLFILVFVFDAIIIARGGDLAARATLPTTAFWLTWAAALSALVAAIFGSYAFAHAEHAGFPTEHIAEHAGFGNVTVAIFVVLVILLSFLRWRKISLTGMRGGIFTSAVLIGVVSIGLTAYHGGHLVYELGINVRGVTPEMAKDLAAQHGQHHHDHHDAEHDHSSETGY